MSQADALSCYEPLRVHGLGDVIREQSRSRPGRVAVVDGDLSFTYPELNARVDRVANLLGACGVGEGDRVLWVGQNSFRVLEVLLAAAKLGAMLAPANWRCSAAEIIAFVEDFDPKVVFWQEAEVGDIARQARDALGGQDRVWIGHDLEGAEGYEGRVAVQPATDGERPVSPDLPLLGIFTAAFGGRPGAALLSHTALMQQGMLMMTAMEVRQNSSYLVSGPMFHIGVLQAMFSVLMAGGTNVFVARMDAQQVLELIGAHRVTHAYVPRPTLEQMRELNQDGRYDVSSLFATPDMADWKGVSCMPSTAPMMQGVGQYGQTELSGLATLVWLGGTGAGVPGPFLQVRILDDDGVEVPTGAVGEICARGSMVMCGYWGRPEENARRTSHGWHRTNDLGMRKEDGSIVFVGPKTAMIKSGLENIYPAEVEACIKTHDAVLDVCVIGVPDPVWAQNVRAVIVARPGAEVSETDIIEHCRARIASYKKPKSVVLVEAIPKTAHGFTDRAAVDAAHGGGGYPKMGA